MKISFDKSILLLLSLVTQSAAAENRVISSTETVSRDYLVFEMGSEQPFTGQVISTRYDGSRAYSETYENGKLHGTRTEWDRSGNRTVEKNFVNGAITGTETYWYTNGQVMAVTNYLNGAKDGLATRWCENGQKRFEGLYFDNMKHGEQHAWYVDGQKRAEGTFRNDRARGPRTSWYANGQIEFEIKRDADSELIVATNWYESGQKRCEASGEIGEKTPTKIAWNEHGEILDLDDREYRLHCFARFESSKPLPNEDMVSVRTGPEGSTRYGTASGKTTATEIEVDESDLSKIKAIANEALECGLPPELTL